MPGENILNEEDAQFDADDLFGKAGRTQYHSGLRAPICSYAVALSQLNAILVLQTNDLR